MKPDLVDIQEIILIISTLILAFIVSNFTRKVLARSSLNSSRKLNVDPTNY